MRGEYFFLTLSAQAWKGSPPLAWGIPCKVVCVGVHVRITPTCVGNTRRLRKRRWRWWDHPHLRGEYKPPLSNITDKPGSPPLAWGIPIVLCCLSVLSRITPTCVGNTCKLSDSLDYLRDHPHLHGEYWLESYIFRSTEGSPPLAWGIQKVSTLGKFFPRITPTCVGNTFFKKGVAFELKDHPHLRGEYLVLRSVNTLLKGSPPLAWGIRC